jgi:hypothetical protein
MPLKMRPSGLGSEIDNDCTDYLVFCGNWNIGRILHKNIQHTVRYTEMAPDRFKDFWRD